MDSLRNLPAEPSLAQVIAEIVEGLLESAQTRLEMLGAELRENLHSWKVAMPVVIMAAVLMGSAYLLFLAALVDVTYVLLPPMDFRWAIALAIVGGVWGIPGAVMAYFAAQKLRQPPLVPRKTLEILKADKEWVESEIKAA
jgi:uncharacterized membrane protein YqjE